MKMAYSCPSLRAKKIQCGRGSARESGIFPSQSFETPELLSFEHDRDNQNRQNVCHFDHRIDGRSGRVLVWVPNSVAGDGGLVRG
jgi:hypothetical protein